MTKTQLILNRYKPLAKAGAGGFGTVQVAWDTRIQRKVAIKCIPLSEAELLRAALPGADAIDVSPDERSESVIASSVHAAGSAGSSSSIVDPADVPPWEDLPEEAGFAGSGDAGDSGASDDQKELASVSVSQAGCDSAGTSSSDASLGQLLPGQSAQPDEWRSTLPAARWCARSRAFPAWTKLARAGHSVGSQHRYGARLRNPGFHGVSDHGIR